MALPTTLYQIDLALNHVDRQIEAQLNVRTARHPSETMQRTWLRVLAYAWHYRERIQFGPGLSDPDTPDLLALDLQGNTELWVRVGKADPVKVQRVKDQNKRATVAVFFESPQRLETFQQEARDAGCTRLSEVELIAIEPSVVQTLARNEERRQKLQLTIVGEHFYLEHDGQSFDGGLVRG